MSVRDIVLTRKEIRLLKRIPETGRHDLTREAVYPLIHAGVVSVGETDSETIFYYRNATGSRFLENHSSENIRYWITTGIALVALIKSFLPELLAAWAWLLRLLELQ